MKAKAFIGLKSFDAMGLIPGLNAALSEMSISKPTPIQSLAIPSLLANTSHHMLAAQTGTGKTLAYVLPIFQLLKQQELEQNQPLTEPKAPRAVILVPNRELSRQCESVLSNFKHQVRLKTFSMFSGQKWKLEAEELKKGVDILVGTPDRIDKHRVEGNLKFTHVQNLVVDESDTMIDAGFSKHLDLYYKELAGQARLTFVAATFPYSLQRFLDERFSTDETSKLYLKKIIEEKTHLNLTHLNHEFIQLSEFDKNPLFLKVIKDIDAGIGSGSCMVFCNSIQSARATEYTLTNCGIRAVSLHGDVPPKKRISNTEAFAKGEVRYLVCTDLASRGLDFPNVSYVVQYDFPKTQSDYVHRAGRAGRAGKAGSVITLYRKADIPVVNQFKVSYNKNKPLNITSSAYSLKNKEFLMKMKTKSLEKMKNILHKTIK